MRSRCTKKYIFKYPRSYFITTHQSSSLGGLHVGQTPYDLPLLVLTGRQGLVRDDDGLHRIRYAVTVHPNDPNWASEV